LTTHKVAIKVIRTNNESDNGHEKMNKVCDPLVIIRFCCSCIRAEIAEGDFNMAQAGSRKHCPAPRYHVRLWARQSDGHGLPVAGKW
jgi:hypothetical protein